jgi:HPr kinase/phosphorylase
MAHSTHASLVALKFKHLNTPFGVLIMGASGAGKSRLALELMCLGSAQAMALERVQLVADDQVLLALQGAEIIGSCPPTIKGLLEVRALGVVAVEPLEAVAIGLVVELIDQPPRLPIAHERSINLEVEGTVCILPLLQLHAPAPLPSAVVLAAYALAQGESLENLQNSAALKALF